MKVIQTIQSPNFSQTEIPVEFCILHYTACDLATTLEIFQDPSRGVCSHFVIAPNGDCYDLGSFLSGPIFQGAHAGKSQWSYDGKTIEKLNECSVGIELVNLNGNLFPYSPEQYQSLTKLLKKLQMRFPKLRDAKNILGHEHIAGFRGKSDPGTLFDWTSFLKSLGLRPEIFHSSFACNTDDLKFLENEKRNSNLVDSQFWMDLSSKLEKRIEQRKLSHG